MDVGAMIGGCIAVVTLLIGLMKFFSAQVESKLASRDEEQDKQLTNHDVDIAAIKATLADTRTELHRDYVHRDQLTELQHKMDGDFANTFGRLDGLSRDLNQLIGRLAERYALPRNGVNGE